MLQKHRELLTVQPLPSSNLVGFPTWQQQDVLFFLDKFIQFQNHTEAWTYMKATRVPPFFKGLIKSLKLIAPSVLSYIFSDMEGRQRIWFLSF